MKSLGAGMTIGELARLADCRVDTIRYYERIGLLPKPGRSEGGQRRYGEAEARQLLFVRRLRDLGFSLDEAAGFVALRRRRTYGCAEFKQIADARIAQSRRQTARLRRLERRLREISAHCADGADCGVIEALWAADSVDLELLPRGTVCCAGASREA